MPDQDMMVKTIGGGWLLVTLDSGEKVSLPEYCHVKLHKSAAGRDQITIQEGSYARKKASVASGYLTTKKHESKAVVNFYLKSNVLSWSGGPAVRSLSNGRVSGGLAAFTQATDEVPSGLWDIEMPDHPHKLGDGYKSLAGHAITWFRIASPGSPNRFIHVGTISEGCTTVGIKGDKSSVAGKTALSNYELLYSYLINRRKSPGIVGEIQVLNY